MDRRQFLRATGLAAATPLIAGSGQAAASAALRERTIERVDFVSDGLGLEPPEYAAQLAEVASAPGFEADDYSNGGAVQQLERQFAHLLGKEAAMFVPTGTLANHIAVRTLAGDSRRVLVQAESHLYNDSGDGAQTLSGLNLVPLAQGRGSVTVADVQPWVERSASGRVPLKVGAISIESPVRRRDHEQVDHAELERLCRYARDNAIGLHLDGARMFNLPHHSGVSVRDYAALFDTVYVSLWKHFNAASGAILAGDAAFIDGLFHVRRMFGGSLPHAWPQAALAARYTGSYGADYAQSWLAADRLIELLQADGRFKVRRVVNGTSRFYLAAPPVAAELLVSRLAAQGVVLPQWVAGDSEIPMQVNPTLLRASPEVLAGKFIQALEA